MNRAIARAVVAIAVLVGATAAGAATAVSIGAQSTTEGDSHVAFGDGVIATERGGNATIPVEMEGTDTATLQIGSDEAVNYALVVTVTDGDGDGAVAVSFDTDAAGEDGATKVATRSAADSVAVESETEHFGGEPPHPPLDPGTYPIELYEGSGEDRKFVAESRMVIEEAETTTEATTTTGETTTTDAGTEPEPTGTTAATAATDGIEGDVPGFGPVVGLVALAAAALLAVRR